MRTRQRRTKAASPDGRGARRTIELHLISSAAELLDMHPQTLRKYERLGLVQPLRTLGSMRVYSADELERLRLIKFLVDEAGINLAGVKMIMQMREQLDELRRAADEMQRELRRQRERVLRDGGAGEIVPLRTWLDFPWPGGRATEGRP